MTQIATHELAALLGLSERSVRDLARRQILIREGRGFDRDASVKSYCAHLRAAATGRPSTATVAVERARLLRLQADRVEREAEREAGQWVRHDDVEIAQTRFVLELRTALLALPSRLAGRCGLTRQAALLADDEVRDILNELADNAHAIAVTVGDALTEARKQRRSKNDANIRGARARHHPTAPGRAAAT